MDRLRDGDGGGGLEASLEDALRLQLPTAPAQRPTTSFRIRPTTAVRNANPRPRPVEVEDLEARDDDASPDQLFSSILNEEKLCSITGMQDLTAVVKLELKVDTTEQSISMLGELLPSLRHLKLNDSCIASLRDLGTHLRNVEVMWLNRCGMKDIDGIGAFSSLRELFVSFNDISDVKYEPLVLYRAM